MDEIAGSRLSQWPAEKMREREVEHSGLNTPRRDKIIECVNRVCALDDGEGSPESS